MKTPEQMAEEYCEDHDECEFGRDAFLAGYQAAQQWISVKERLPEDISDVLILSKEKESCVGYYRSSDNDWNMYNPCCSFHMELHGITHWQPLPAAPKEEV